MYTEWCISRFPWTSNKGPLIAKQWWSLYLKRKGKIFVLTKIRLMWTPSCVHKWKPVKPCLHSCFPLSSLTNNKVNSDCKARYTGSLSFVFVCFGKQLQNNKSDKLNSFRLPRSSQRRVGGEGSCLARRLWDLPAQKGLSLPPLFSPTDTFKELDINFSN